MLSLHWHINPTRCLKLSIFKCMCMYNCTLYMVMAINKTVNIMYLSSLCSICQLTRCLQLCFNNSTPVWCYSKIAVGVCIILLICLSHHKVAFRIRVLSFGALHVYFSVTELLMHRANWFHGFCCRILPLGVNLKMCLLLSLFTLTSWCIIWSIVRRLNLIFMAFFGRTFPTN